MINKKYTVLFFIVCTVISCSKSTNGDKFQKNGAFRLEVPSDTMALGPRSDSAAGYSVLDDAYTNTDVMLDVRLLHFIYQADSSTVEIASSGVDQGGLVLATGAIAPNYTYPHSWLLRLQMETYPLRFWLLCRDNTHYAQLTLDSMAIKKVAGTPDSTFVCDGYFHYTQNLEEYDRQF